MVHDCLPVPFTFTSNKNILIVEAPDRSQIHKLFFELSEAIGRED
jgi:hypothetical protein